MTTMQLTYDAVEDRILLLSHQEVSYPSWWISRKKTLWLIQSLNSAVAAHYETEKILQKVSEAQTSETTNRNGSPDTQSTEQSLHQYRQAHLEGKSTSVEKHTEHFSDAQLYPYARVIKLDLLANNELALVLSDGDQKGMKLQFHEQGVHQFSRMCCEVVQQCAW